MKRLWDKGEPLDKRVLRYTAGEDYLLDERLVPYDVRASIAHAKMLCKQGLISAEDSQAITNGLNALATSHAAGEWKITLEDEDVHTALEKHLTDTIGEAGKRVHLGRSRNDQVLTALRLYMLDAAGELHKSALDAASALKKLGKQNKDVALPGYTHMQQGMPSSVELWANGFAAELEDDANNIVSALQRADKNPLGSAAGYGTPGLELDREFTREALNFTVVHEPVTAVQLSRGKAEAALVFELSLLMQDLSKLATDLLMYYTQEFAFVKLPENMTTGSSIMPQKRNPDVLELVRSAAATINAALLEILGITTKLGSGYQRDLQRIKPPLFRAIDLAGASTEIMVQLISGIKFLPENIQLDPSIYAAEKAYQLVTNEGISFRDAYRRIAAELNNDE
ncbi:MAG: argininosuccinate lyase [Gammaproteobacteria bacterium]|nr:argininosuccinate lyase [Gammaproteobacteria bacterium]MCP4091667.1 argininosuccinate lyase [Gammaproteobacteria bacterium]MCP4276163.1 argininosuccinate lyase [Gammaproteobacteria bacterium]MCP4831797.1 argininosuccinate lyase [Gammaproteobacteria bacterium]MCP4929733.1 argininosuccinate lyase [Gammaproteobacteria bacterium]